MTRVDDLSDPSQFLYLTYHNMMCLLRAIAIQLKSSLSFIWFYVQHVQKPVHIWHIICVWIAANYLANLPQLACHLPVWIKRLL